MISKKIEIINHEGLHGRPVNFFNACAGCFQSCVWIQKDERRANAKSLMGTLSLSVTQGQEVTLIADGKDEQEAIEMLAKLINSGFNDQDLIDDIKSR